MTTPPPIRDVLGAELESHLGFRVIDQADRYVDLGAELERALRDAGYVIVPLRRYRPTQPTETREGTRQ